MAGAAARTVDDLVQHQSDGPPQVAGGGGGALVETGRRKLENDREQTLGLHHAIRAALKPYLAGQDDALDNLATLRAMNFVSYVPRSGDHTELALSIKRQLKSELERNLASIPEGIIAEGSADPTGTPGGFDLRPWRQQLKGLQSDFQRDQKNTYDPAVAGRAALGLKLIEELNRRTSDMALMQVVSESMGGGAQR